MGTAFKSFLTVRASDETAADADRPAQTPRGRTLREDLARPNGSNARGAPMSGPRSASAGHSSRERSAPGSKGLRLAVSGLLFRSAQGGRHRFRKVRPPFRRIRQCFPCQRRHCESRKRFIHDSTRPAVDFASPVSCADQRDGSLDGVAGVVCSPSGMRLQSMGFGGVASSALRGLSMSQT